jgi:hypothetical protein
MRKVPAQPILYMAGIEDPFLSQDANAFLSIFTDPGKTFLYPVQGLQSLAREMSE